MKKQPTPSTVFQNTPICHNLTLSVPGRFYSTFIKTSLNIVMVETIRFRFSPKSVPQILRHLFILPDLILPAKCYLKQGMLWVVTRRIYSSRSKSLMFHTNPLFHNCPFTSLHRCTTTYHRLRAMPVIRKRPFCTVSSPPP